MYPLSGAFPVILMCRSVLWIRACSHCCFIFLDCLWCVTCLVCGFAILCLRNFLLAGPSVVWVFSCLGLKQIQTETPLGFAVLVSCARPALQIIFSRLLLKQWLLPITRLIYVAFTICSGCVTSILLLEEWLVLPCTQFTTVISHLRALSWISRL